MPGVGFAQVARGWEGGGDVGQLRAVAAHHAGPSGIRAPDAANEQAIGGEGGRRHVLGKRWHDLATFR